MPGIGSLNEKPLHASIKEWIARPGDRFEVTVDGYVIDIVRDDVLIEIQTGSFASLRTKLRALSGAHQVRLVYPVAMEKWIVKQKNGGPDEASRRKSPKKGRIEDLFHELVSFPDLILNPNFSIEVLMTKVEEFRHFQEGRNWRRRGWSITERRLIDVTDRRMFRNADDLKSLLPDNIGTPFTTKTLSELSGLSRRLAGEMVYCLHKAKVIGLAGKEGRFKLYSYPARRIQ
ncbi:hypothetical protein JW948_02060 [bacterium]|nr:hypothetical protein [bacterium]